MSDTGSRAFLLCSLIALVVVLQMESHLMYASIFPLLCFLYYLTIVISICTQASILCMSIYSLDHTVICLQCSEIQRLTWALWQATKRGSCTSMYGVEWIWTKSKKIRREPNEARKYLQSLYLLKSSALSVSRIDTIKLFRIGFSLAYVSYAPWTNAFLHAYRQNRTHTHNTETRTWLNLCDVYYSRYYYCYVLFCVRARPVLRQPTPYLSHICFFSVCPLECVCAHVHTNTYDIRHKMLGIFVV